MMILTIILRVYDLYNHYFQECRRCHQEMEEIQSKAIQKIQKIYHELVDHPRTGIGHPEALVGGNSILYSRHITAHDRIIYEIHDDVITVLILDVEGHYNDK